MTYTCIHAAPSERLSYLVYYYQNSEKHVAVLFIYKSIHTECSYVYYEKKICEKKPIKW